MAVFVFALLIHLVEYVWCSVKKKIQKAARFRTKSSVEQYLTVYEEKLTSEIIKKIHRSEEWSESGKTSLEIKNLSLHFPAMTRFAF